MYFTYSIHHSKLNDAEYHQQHDKYIQLEELATDDDDDDDVTSPMLRRLSQ